MLCQKVSKVKNLKVSSHEIFYSKGVFPQIFCLWCFYHQTTSPGPIIHAQKDFLFCQTIVELFVFIIDSQTCSPIVSWDLQCIRHRGVVTPSVFITGKSRLPSDEHTGKSTKISFQKQLFFNVTYRLFPEYSALLQYLGIQAVVIKLQNYKI